MAGLLTSFALVLSGLALDPSPALVSGSGASHRLIAPPKIKPAPAHEAPALTCKVLTTEAPRGGRLEVEGHGFGRAPLVRIGGKITRMIERTETRIAVQIPADSNGGPVTVIAGKQEATCGTLTIIGKD